MKLPRAFYQPLAIGAPEPMRELPVKLERMIHFVPPHMEKIRGKVPELIRDVDVVLGNREGAGEAAFGLVALVERADLAAEAARPVHRLETRRDVGGFGFEEIV